MAATDITAAAAIVPRSRSATGLMRRAARRPLPVLGSALLIVLILSALFAPWLTPYDPFEMNVVDRLLPPNETYWFGTDAFGRDIFTRTLYGGRVSLVIGASVAVAATVVGLLIGVVAGYFRTADAILMRIMDGLMAIPGILLAIALMSLTRASIWIVILAITIPEVPRVARLVRSVVLSVREQVYIQAASAVGTRFPRLMLRHILPNTFAPLIVQATYIAASAVLVESYLSFLGVGTPPEIPSWGNIIAEGRLYVQIAFWNILFPSVFLAVMVLSINILGDGLRDMLDPRLARRI
ncbi:MAG: ABC transporter permease [Roseomonas sp.]|jgi:peptide/nickel transport system permease protein|nr:ABC transporter permease [Roseomonas sp.]MCA3405703.1 ABC transporter permease [Roseomonas sp.]MCA3414318.1 ABC transporter permease [Roseomonas sp.]MCZ8140129.1 ABC transporter permease [Acetobacteraceae bacterium]MCZ8277960.1 ABC transporter permease [Acetobacteraceae bacterium]